MMVGQGTTPEMAYKDYLRKVNWYDRGQPKHSPARSVNFVAPLSVQDSLDRLTQKRK